MLTLYSDQVPSYHKIHCPQEDLTYLCCYNPSNGMSDLKVHLFAAKVDTEITDIDKKEESILGLLYAIQFYL